MKIVARIGIGMGLMVCGLVACGAPPVESFVKDVRVVAGPGSPGSVIGLGEGVEAVVVGEVGGGAVSPVCVAAEWGKGRVVAFGHSGYLDTGVLDVGETGVLMERLVGWASGGVKKAAVLDGGLAAWLEKQGYGVVRPGKIDGESLRGVGVVLLGGRELSESQREELQKWIRGGGGLIAAQTGWGWQQIAARGGPSPDMRTNSLNRMLLGAGIGWTDEIVEKTKGEGFDGTRRGAGPMTLPGALDALMKAEGSEKKATGREERRALAQASATASRGVRLLPKDDRTVRPKLRAMMAKHAGEMTPTEGAPLKAERALPRMLMALQVDEMNGLSADEVRAHPASKAFPGEVSSGAERVTRRVEVDTSVPRWHSTGLYAPAGGVVTVTVDGDEVEGLGVRIGCHTDELWHLAEWKRVPEISRSWSLKRGANRVASAFGGLVYVEVSGRARGVRSVTIAGAVESPRFVLGKTTKEEWARLRRTPGAWGEIETPSVIVSVPASALRGIEDPTEIATLWQEILDHAADLRGIPRKRWSPERYVPDVQISAGYMHSGYPIMTHMDVVKDLSDAATLRAGSWGLFHELGHNHQDGMWTFDGTVEVTCNLWSLYLMEKVAGKPIGTGHGAVDSKDERTRRMVKYMAGGADFSAWKRDPFLALEMYIQMREAFGWEPFTKVFVEMDALPGGQRPRTDLDRHDEWMTRMSRATGRNLGPFFEKWGVPTSPGARASVSGLPGWMPEGLD